MKLIVGNWKMHMTLEKISSFFKDLSSYSLNCEAWIAPQFIHLQHIISIQQKIKIGAQNCSSQNQGAFTGEISPESLKEIGVHFVILGHSERRQIFHESSLIISPKVKQAILNGLKVIYCVGETLEERKAGLTLEVISKQLEEGIPTELRASAQLIIAYEPVWAIGTGLTATPEEAQIVHQFIKKWLPTSITPVLYGGSVKPQNIKELLAKPEIDGALVGGASLNPQDFAALCL